MPAFTFEKISSRTAPSAKAGAQTPSRQASVGQSRTLIHSMLDRLAVARLKREEAKRPAKLPHKPPPD